MDCLPGKVKVLHHVYSVVPAEAAEYGYLGLCDNNALRIKIAERCGPGKQLECLWHELAHVYTHTFQWFEGKEKGDEKEEEFCRNLATIVMQILRDNPCILQLHTNLLEETVDNLPDDDVDEE